MGRNINKKRTLFFKELKIVIFFILLGALLMFTNSDSASWRYPLSPSPEMAEGVRLTGKLILIGGYPFTIIVRLIIKLINKIKKRSLK